MGTAYSEFDTTPATIVADIKAKILLSADWANATGQVCKATTTDGAEMVVDLAGAAATNLQMQLLAWRTHNGVSGTDSITRYLAWHRTAATSAATDTVHCVVSAGKDHLYISVEGPRSGETNADGVTGSHKSSFALAAIVPYYAGDSIDSVCCIGNPNVSTATATNLNYVAVNRNQANNASWVLAILETVSQPSLTIAGWNQGAWVDSEGNVVLRPWVVREGSAGDRGRLKSIYYAGLSSTLTAGDPLLAVGQKVTYGGETFTLQLVGRNAVAANFSGQGWYNPPITGGGSGVLTPLVAVPSA